MQINSLTPTSLASTVWTNAARTLTAFPLAALNSELVAGAQCTSAASQGVLGAYVQLLASLAHNVVGLCLIVRGGAADLFKLTLATGPGGSEVPTFNVQISQSATLAQTLSLYVPLDPSLFIKGTRLSAAIANQSDGTAQILAFSVTVLEDAA